MGSREFFYRYQFVDTEGEVSPRMTRSADILQGILIDISFWSTLTVSLSPALSEIFFVLPTLEKLLQCVASPDIPPRGIIAITVPPL